MTLSNKNNEAERLERETGRKKPNTIRDEIRRFQNRIGRLPKPDDRSDEEILDYDEQGLPN